MPKDYSRGKIYKIVCNITNKIYIGSTCEPTLARRLAKHVSNFKDWKNGKTNKVTSFEIIEGGDYYIELLEICPCTINEELLARERFYIKSIECVNRFKNLNCTKEDSKEYKKKWYNENINKIKENNKEYYNKNIDRIKEQKKEYFKEYYNKNIDKMKEKNKKYRELRKLKKENSLTETNPL
jgi:hypothetical protein